jgi:signal transduction histidine kinase
MPSVLPADPLENGLDQWVRVSQVTLIASLAGWGIAVVAVVLALTLRARLEAVARAEHELRGPATVLFLVCERLGREPAGRRHADAIATQLERLGAGLADLDAAHRGRRAGERPEPVELNRFARSAVDGWRPALDAAGRDARIDWRAGPARVVADRGRLAQALGNLLANAAEHGDGPVELRGRRVNGGVRVEVRNAARQPGERRPGAGDPRPGWGHDEGDRGRGLGIAARAAASAGGRLDLVRDGGEVVAAIELPDAA